MPRCRPRAARHARHGVQPDHTALLAVRRHQRELSGLVPKAGMSLATQVFASVLPLLDALDRLGHPWGVVTNKAGRFTDPLVRSLGLHSRAITVIAGDTTPHSKPHPAPLLEAARRAGWSPAQCMYVGDDLRDVQAGHAAGMTTV